MILTLKEQSWCGMFCPGWQKGMGCYPCRQSVRMLFLSKWDITMEWMTCSRVLHTTDLGEIGL